MERVDIFHEQTPDFRLLPGETLQKIIEFPQRKSPSPPSSLEQMQRLTGATSSEDIGKFGPSLASLHLDIAKPAPDEMRLYETVFGRDSLRVSRSLLPNYPKLARTTLLELARLQGTTYNQTREEEPGRIVHEVRAEDSKIAMELTRERGWGWPYYGSVDATVEFVRTMAEYCNLDETNLDFLQEGFINKNGEYTTMADSLTHATNWILRRLGSNPEGLLEFKSVLPKGIENQVWKDSWDAYHHNDGQIANHNQGIASIEVQVSTYDALLDMAELLRKTRGGEGRAAQLEKRAEILKQTILDIFWTEDRGGYFVLGTDRDDDGSLRQLKIRTSNMGHVLNSRLLEDGDPAITHKRQSIMQHLMSPEMLNISGIRTLASDEYRFRPGAYQNGSVWLWDTHYIATGMRRHGYDNEASELDNRTLKVIEATHSFPEYVRGDDADTPSVNERMVTVWDSNHSRINKVEQPPQEVQAWTVASILAIKKKRAAEAILPS